VRGAHPINVAVAPAAEPLDVKSVLAVVAAVVVRFDPPDGIGAARAPGGSLQLAAAECVQHRSPRAVLQRVAFAVALGSANATGATPARTLPKAGTFIQLVAVVLHVATEGRATFRCSVPAKRIRNVADLTLGAQAARLSAGAVKEGCRLLSFAAAATLRCWELWVLTSRVVLRTSTLALEDACSIVPAILSVGRRIAVLAARPQVHAVTAVERVARLLNPARRAALRGSLVSFPRHARAAA